MSFAQFIDSLAPCCTDKNGDGRSCQKFQDGDRVTFDGGGSAYSVRAYTGTVWGAVQEGAAAIEYDGYNHVGQVASRKLFHLK